MTNPNYLILGHRGCRNAAFHQNSMAAFREALEAADGLETDTALSRDGALFLIHDITYIYSVEYTLREHLTAESAARAGDRRLDQMDAAEIETLRLKNGEPIPRLDQLLALYRSYPDAVLNVELKSDNTAKPTVALLRAAIADGDIRLEQVVLSSFNLPALAWVRQHAPEFRLGVLFSYEIQRREPLFPWAGKPDSCYTPFDRNTFDTPLLREIAPEFINLSTNTMSLANIAAVQAAYPRARFITWPGFEPNEGQAPYLMELLGYLAGRGLLHAWITDEPRLRRAALVPKDV